MEIHIRRNGRSIGRYSPEQIWNALARKELTLDDDAWTRGLNDWTPLRFIVQPSSGPTGGPVPARPKRRIGCCGLTALIGAGLIALLTIFSWIYDPDDSDLQIKGTVGTITMHVIPTNTPALVGNLIASKVYHVSTKHAALDKIIVNVEFNPALLVDKYGHEVRGPLHMGTITVDDLEEVRRYEIDGAYMRHNAGAFTSQVSHMDYVGNLGM